MTNGKQPESKEKANEKKRPNLCDQKTIETILKTVANGGSLNNLSISWNIRYANIVNSVLEAMKHKVYSHEVIFSRYEWVLRPTLELLNLVYALDRIENEWKEKFKNLEPTLEPPI